MKKIEFTPDGKPTIISPRPAAWEEPGRDDILREILPVLFHKMKNKLTPILGYAQILRARSGDDFFKERLARIEGNAGELSEAFNRIKERFLPGPINKKPMDINLILEGMAGRWQEIARHEKATIVLELAAGLPLLALDAGQIGILLLNMVENAALALKDRQTPAREIRLTTQAEGSAVKLVVRDNGRGMDAEELAGIWTPLRSNFPDRAGLGLVICERIMANHGAACAVTSVPGEFSQFEILFPAEDHSHKQNESAGPEAAPATIKEVP